MSEIKSSCASICGFARLSSLFVLLSLLVSLTSRAQWLEFDDETDTRLLLTSVANSDDEEKDISVADLNNDGWDDVIVVRKEPFSISNEGAKSDLLLMNVNGVLTDQTDTFAPEFLSNPSFARDIYVGDFDNDGWNDVVVANTFNQQPFYYANLGEDGSGNWLGLEDQSAARFPTLTSDVPLICAVWGGDLTGNGALDLYFVNYKVNAGGGTAKDFLLINNGSGVFTDEGEARLGDLRNSAFGTAVQLIDIDNDGDNDIVKNTTLYNVAPWNDQGVIALFNDGTGNFSNWQNVAPFAPYMFEIRDYNNDGFNDIFVVDDGQDYLITITASVPDNSLTITTSGIVNGVGGFGGNVHAGDLDLDGDQDIIVSDVDVDIPPCNSGRELAILRNDGGVFVDLHAGTPFPWDDNSYDVGILDINNDGLLDFISGQCEGYGIFMSNNCDLTTVLSDLDEDGIADACDACPNNPDPNCEETPEYPVVSTDFNIARQWNEMTLASIRRDFARPTVHARNLYHISLAIYDAWAAYDEVACTYLLGNTIDGFTCTYNGIPNSMSVEADRETAISYACYRILSHRFANAPDPSILQEGYDEHMSTLGHDISFTSTDYNSGNAAALGNYIAQCILAFGMSDGANEANAYENTAYAPVNEALIVDEPGNPTVSDLNRWQPLTLDIFIDQSGNEIPGSTPGFLSPEWGQVKNFALSEEDLTVYERNGFNYLVFHDPGTPPLMTENGMESSEIYKWTFATTAVWSGHLGTDDGVTMDISPATLGNRTLPTNPSDYSSFYDQINGGTSSAGHPVNPVTGQAYAPNVVSRADYARVLAEFWADGPDSETPPGHWFGIFNYVSDHPELEKRFEGSGPVLSDLEWDVKGYFMLGGAMHDAAVTAWGIKGWYDYIRPISAIRAMCDLGQSSDPGGPSYHPQGIPLVAGHIEVIMAGDPLAVVDSNNVGKIKIWSWRGHDVIENVDTDVAGVGWILGENWVPYQRPSFVTPPFAGYVSGHSTYSRAAAELLTMMTADAYFPGGMGEFVAPANEFLVFEDGPSQDVVLQWATYRDAADESGLSRIWGGIHPPADDIPGRIMGIEIGLDAFELGKSYFTDTDDDGTCNFNEGPCEGDFDDNGVVDIGDLLALLSQMGCTGSCFADMDGNQVVGSSDLLTFLGKFGSTCL